MMLGLPKSEKEKEKEKENKQRIDLWIKRLEKELDLTKLLNNIPFKE